MFEEGDRRFAEGEAIHEEGRGRWEAAERSEKPAAGAAGAAGGPPEGPPVGRPPRGGGKFTHFMRIE